MKSRIEDGRDAYSGDKPPITSGKSSGEVLPLDAVDKGALKNWMQDIKANKIRLVCWDFDQTAYTKHTGGVVVLPAGVKNLATLLPGMKKDMSPDFLRCVPLLAEAGVAQCIVTFGDALRNDSQVHGGAPLISPLLELCFGPLGKEIPVFALNPYWRDNQYPFDKSWHMGQAMHHFRKSVTINSEVLLVDDSSQNIALASSAGHSVAYVQTQGFILPTKIGRAPKLQKQLSGPS